MLLGRGEWGQRSATGAAAPDNSDPGGDPGRVYYLGHHSPFHAKQWETVAGVERVGILVEDNPLHAPNACHAAWLVVPAGTMPEARSDHA